MKKIAYKVEWYLKQYPECRSSDKLLLWKIIAKDKESISYYDFLNAPSMESITRARRKVQELHPNLRAEKEVERQRTLKAIKTQAWSLENKTGWDWLNK